MEPKEENISIKISEEVTWEHVRCAGISLPKHVIETLFIENGFAGQLRQVKDLDLCDDDVILAAFPRSGTHWIWEITSMLLRDEAKYQTVDKNYASLDFFGLDALSSLPPPRVLNTHFLPGNLPRVVSEKRNKIVHVQRNVKDIISSLYKFLQINWSMLPEIETFDTFMKYCTGYYGSAFICSWAHYVKTWEEFTKQYPDQIINLKYEDIIEDPVREIRKLNDFLQCNRSDDIIQKIAEACSFAKLKEANSTKTHLFPLQNAHRKGEMGDWKNTFTVAQNEFMDQWLDTNLTDSNLKFRYSI